MGRGSGFGKVILIGEHFVNYGTPGIVSAIDLTTEAEVVRTSGRPLTLRDDRQGTPGYLEAKREQQRESIVRILDAIHLDTDEMQIRLGGSLPVYSGVGASAASCVAVVRALSDEFGLDLRDQEVNAAAYEGEKAYHGPTHAGLDNAAATFGGVLWFFKGPPPSYESARIKEPFEVVIANTGIVANTHEMIAGVARRRAADSDRYALIIREAHTVATRTRAALESGDLAVIGRLLDQNHALLREIEVTHPAQERLVEVARSAGALGAKSTGAGGGGCIVALTPGLELQARVAEAIEREGYEALRTMVGKVSSRPHSEAEAAGHV